MTAQKAHEMVYLPQVRPECWHTEADLRPLPRRVGWLTRRARRAKGSTS